MRIKELGKKCEREYWGIMEVMNAKIALFFTWFFIKTPITPNQITVLSILIEIIGALFLLRGDYINMLIGVIIFQFGFIIDHSDGQVARYKNIVSMKGMYIDQIGHYLTLPLLLGALTYGTYLKYDNIIYLIVGAVALVSFIYSKLFSLNPLWFNVDTNQLKKIRDIFEKFNIKHQGKLKTLIMEFLRLEQPLNLLFWCLLLNQAGIAVFIYAILFFFNMIQILFVQLKKIGGIDKEAKRFTEGEKNGK